MRDVVRRVINLFSSYSEAHFAGETLNIMTLGGLALALGRVVDDSVVDVENTVRHLGMGKTPFQAALDSANEIAVPVFMATLTTVVVFFPITFMEGIGKYLFTPLAISAALAMFASYFVSRTVSPLFCARLLKSRDEPARLGRGASATLRLIDAELHGLKPEAESRAFHSAVLRLMRTSLPAEAGGSSARLGWGD